MRCYFRHDKTHVPGETTASFPEPCYTVSCKRKIKAEGYPNHVLFFLGSFCILRLMMSRADSSTGREKGGGG